MYDAECSVSGKDSIDSIGKFDDFTVKKDELLELIKCGNYLFLVKSIIEKFNKKQGSTLFLFKDLLLESKYLEA